MYALMVGLGLIACIFVCNALGRKRGLPPYDFLSAMAVMAIFAFLGAKLLFGLTNIDFLAEVASRIQNFKSINGILTAIYLAFSGMVFYGGVFGAIAGMLVWLKVTKRPKPDYLDLLAVGIPLFHAITRIGCFLGGCCYGIECDIGFVYTENPIESANGVPRFPVQLLESACEAVLFAVLLSLFRRRRSHGELIWIWLGSYAAIRFLDEFLRGDAFRGFLGPRSTSQWISLAVLAVVAVYAIRRRRVGKRTCGFGLPQDDATV